jgi:hypothetical protein
MLSDMCGACISKMHKPPGYIEPTTAKLDSSGQQATEELGSPRLCLFLGVSLMVLGGYFLLNPSVPVDNGFGIAVSYVANIHRLTLGETFFITGAIFLAAGIRPRYR